MRLDGVRYRQDANQRIHAPLDHAVMLEEVPDAVVSKQWLEALHNAPVRIEVCLDDHQFVARPRNIPAEQRQEVELSRQVEHRPDERTPTWDDAALDSTAGVRMVLNRLQAARIRVEEGESKFTSRNIDGRKYPALLPVVHDTGPPRSELVRHRCDKWITT